MSPVILLKKRPGVKEGIMEKLLSEEYYTEIDTVDNTAWCDIILNFSDANLYQTWSYGAVRWGEKSLSHLLLKKEGTIVACAQVTIIKAPFLPAGIAYMLGGPLWHVSGKEENIEIFRQMIRALKDEYIDGRHMHLRILAHIPHDCPEAITDLMEDEGFTCSASPNSGRTLHINLTPSLIDLRGAVQRQWRNNLKKAEKNGLHIIEGHDIALYEMFSQIYREMHARKKFVEHVHIDEYRLIQSDLPEKLKMHVMVCKSNGNICSALVCSAIGDIAINLLAATSSYDIENRLNSSHLLFWKMMEWAKMKGCTWYDLGGINPDRNPGGYQFKKGLAGTTGMDTYVFQQFDNCKSMLSSIMITCGDYLKTRQNTFKEASLDVSR